MNRIMRSGNDADVAVERRWIALNEGDSLRLQRAGGMRVQVAALSTEAAPLLWLTEEGEADDVFLRDGEGHTLRGAGCVVASAWAPLRVRVTPRAALAPAGAHAGAAAAVRCCVATTR